MLSEQRNFLTQLDTDIGDGDHGLNMSRGFNKVMEKLPSVADKDIGFIFEITGMTLLASIGGASGPLFGTFFIRAAQCTKAKQSLDLEGVREMFVEGIKGIAMRGKAESGDKTMCDVWQAVGERLTLVCQQQLPLDQALHQCLKYASQALNATILMRAKKGHASYLGDRSIGHQDPGATSVKIMLDALYQVVSGTEYRPMLR